METPLSGAGTLGCRFPVSGYGPSFFWGSFCSHAVPPNAQLAHAGIGPAHFPSLTPSTSLDCLPTSLDVVFSLYPQKHVLLSARLQVVIHVVL